MKAEFELNIDANGNPCIKFKHHDIDDSLEQNALGVFLNGVQQKGFVLMNPSGYSEIGTNDSWENYEIQIKD